MSFFFASHSNLLEEVAKFRAARRMWARIMREEFGAADPKSCMLRFHTQTGGVTLTAQQAMNNIELGRNFPTIPNVVHLCEAHDLTMEWVCTGSFKGLRHELVEAIKAESVRQTASPQKRATAAHSRKPGAA